MICPNCQHNNPSENLFCERCGTRLAETNNNSSDLRENGSSDNRSNDSRTSNETRSYGSNDNNSAHMYAGGSNNQQNYSNPNSNNPNSNSQARYDYNSPQSYSQYNNAQGSGQQAYNQYNQNKQSTQQSQYQQNGYNQNQQADYSQSSQANYPNTASSNTVTKKKSKAWLWILLGVALIAAIVVGLFFLFRNLGGARGPNEISAEQLLEVLNAPNTNVYIAGAEDAPFTEASEISLEAGENEPHASYGIPYIVTADLIQENDEVRVEHEDARLNLYYNTDNEEWTAPLGLSFPNAVVKPRVAVSDQAIADAVEYDSFESDSGKYWYAGGDGYESHEVTERTLSEDGLREHIMVDVFFSDVVTEVVATVEYVFEYNYGSWREVTSEDGTRLVQITESPKDGAAFVLDEQAVYNLWAGQTLDLNPYSDTGVFVTLEIPADDPQSVISNVRIIETEESYTPGTYDVEYSFDFAKDDWLSGTWTAQQRFTFNVEDNTYYLADTGTYYSWQLNNADITGDWYGTYTDSSNNSYELQMTLTAMERDPYAYEVLIVARSGGDEGTFDGTAELSTGTSSLRFSFSQGNWVGDAADFYRFSFSGYVIPDTETIESRSWGTLNLSRDESGFTESTTEATSEETEETTEGETEETTTGETTTEETTTNEE